jgi:3-deoxy-D-arabino-heptulosonate 7-phosphate (DAHP) synthase
MENTEQINHTIQENLDILLNYIQSGVETAGGFIAEQTPLLIQEILSFKFIEHLLFSLLYFGLFAFFGLFFI